MFKILLVDDEPIITKGLRKLIHWEELGCEVVGDADDGREAYRLAEEKKPDIIITDILMPVMGGIDFIKKVSESRIDAKLIVLSGYGEFEYAREAFTHGAVEYLMKPVTREKLTSVVHNTIEIIKQERSFSKKIELIKTQLRESIPLLRQKFLLDVIHGEIPADDINRKSEFLNIDLSGAGYAVYAVSVDNIDSNAKFSKEQDKQLLKFAAVNILDEIVDRKYKGYSAISGDILYLILIPDTSDVPMREIFDIAYKVRECLYEYLGAVSSIGISRLYTNAGLIEKAYNEANNALKFKYSLGEGNIIHINDIAPVQEGQSAYPLDAEKKVIESILFDISADPSELSSFLSKSFMEASKGKIKLLNAYCLEFYVQLKRSLRDLGESADNILPYIGEVEYTIRECKSVFDLFCWLSDLIVKVNQCVAAKRKAREYDVIQEAKSYIDLNFSGDISLNKVASKVYMSPTYFSAVFKSKTGENFSDYLTRVRMENAAKLLNDNSYKTYEIAGSLGYKNPRYFSEAFKKFFGVTPSEYRDKHVDRQLE